MKKAKIVTISKLIRIYEILRYKTESAEAYFEERTRHLRHVNRTNTQNSSKDLESNLIRRSPFCRILNETGFFGMSDDQTDVQFLLVGRQLGQGIHGELQA